MKCIIWVTGHVQNMGFERNRCSGDRRSPVKCHPMNQQTLRALVVLLASIALVPSLIGRPDVERPSTQTAAKSSGNWHNSLRLDTFGPGSIVIPPVPPPEPSFYAMWFSDAPLTSFDNPPPRRTAIPDLGSLLDCDVAVPSGDDIVIPAVPPPAKTQFFNQEVLWKTNGPRELVPRPMPQSEISPCSICGKYH